MLEFELSSLMLTDEFVLALIVIVVAIEGWLRYLACNFATKMTAATCLMPSSTSAAGIRQEMSRAGNRQRLPNSLGCCKAYSQRELRAARLVGGDKQAGALEKVQQEPLSRPSVR